MRPFVEIIAAVSDRSGTRIHDRDRLEAEITLQGDDESRTFVPANPIESFAGELSPRF